MLTLCSTVVVAVLSLLTAAAIHNRCVAPPPPVDTPDPGTPLAKYCASVLPHRTLLLVFAPTCLMFISGLLLRRRFGVIFIVATVLSIGLIVNVIYVHGLQWANTI